LQVFATKSNMTLMCDAQQMEQTETCTGYEKESAVCSGALNACVTISYQ
jgi:hypothetical protein